MDQLRAEATLAMRVAALKMAGHPINDIPRILDAKPADVRNAMDRLRRIAPLIDRDAA